jgi:hypothetical protein
VCEDLCAAIDAEDSKSAHVVWRGLKVSVSWPMGMTATRTEPSSY